MSDPARTDRPSLQRQIGRFGLFSLAFGSMIGVGWVTAMGSWLGQAGSVGSMLAFVIGGSLMVCIGLCYAELTALMPVAGGEVAYAYKAYGTGKSFLVGWFLAFGYLSVSAFEAISVGTVLSYLLPGVDFWPLYTIGGVVVYFPHLVLAAAFTLLITWINYRGVQSAARFQAWMTFIFVIVTFVFIGAALGAGRVTDLAPWFGAGAAGTKGVVAGVAAVVVTVPFWFVGFDTIPQSAEETQASVSPRRMASLIPLAIVGAVAFYVLLILSTSMLGNRDAVLQADLPTAQAFEIALQSPWLVNLVLVAALLGLLTSWNGFFLAGSRVLFALGRGRIIAEGLGDSHPRYKTPHRAVILSGLVTLAAAFLGRGALLAFVNVGSFCIAIAFAGVALTFLKLKTTMASAHRPYVAPAGRAVGYVAFAGGVAILAFMIWPLSPAALAWPLEWIILLTFSLLGLGFWTASRRLRDATSSDRRDYLVLDTMG